MSTSSDSGSGSEVKMQMVSELHVYSGKDFGQHVRLQIGHLCPDEILDLELDLTEKEDSAMSFQDSQSIIMKDSVNDSYTGIVVSEPSPDRKKERGPNYELVKCGTIKITNNVDETPFPAEMGKAPYL